MKLRTDFTPLPSRSAEVFAKWSEKKREEFLENLAWVSERCRAIAGAPSKKPRQK